MIKQAKRSHQWHEEFRQEVLADSESLASYEAARLQYELAENMKRKRKLANMTQEEVAARMHSTKTAVSRLESTTSAKHSPSISTLCRYAAALGLGLKISFIPLKQAKHRS